MSVLADRIEDLSPSEAWMADARRVVDVAGGLVQGAVDMTHAKATVETLRAAGVAVTFTHVIVRAVALALTRRPDLYRAVYGYDRVTTERVDLGLSMTGLDTQLPLVLANAETRSMRALVGAIEEGVDAVRAQELRLRRWFWLVPFGFLRRWLVRRWHDRLASRRRLAGTFEVTCDSNADVVVPLRFYTDCVLSAGRVRDVVVVVDGKPAIRPQACLTLVVDHVAMDGMRGAALMRAVKEVLEGEELIAEADAAGPPEGAQA